VLAVREAFKPATLISGESNDIYVDSGFRRAETVFDVGPFASVFEQRVSRYLDFACARLGCPHFTQPSFELQLTAMPSGGFFREHDDNSHTNNRSRQLTFVYYFFLRPLTWSGGALRFSPTGDWLAPVDVPPVENRLVFFDSSLRHEVLPYISNVDGLEGSRFTLNGWVHQDSWP
jgi:Rps23 Pro-64 3,4-dihydroxylase Tpa1-like proline 4-hydroxylase